MVHAQISNEYIHLALMYITDNIFTVLPIKHLVNQEGELTTPHKLTTVTNLQYQTYVFYSIHMLYKRQIHMLTQRS